MKSPPTREDRLYRLKIRLGWRPKKYRTRIKPGGWITLPPALGVRAGDQWLIERIDDTLVLRRVDPEAARRFDMLINRPGQPNARLQKSMRTPPPWSAVKQSAARATAALDDALSYCGESVDRIAQMEGNPNSLAAALTAIPNVGESGDFERIERLQNGTEKSFDRIFDAINEIERRIQEHREDIRDIEIDLKKLKEEGRD